MYSKYTKIYSHGFFLNKELEAFERTRNFYMHTLTHEQGKRMLAAIHVTPTLHTMKSCINQKKNWYNIYINMVRGIITTWKIVDRMYAV